jgi:hypothetical protein
MRHSAGLTTIVSGTAFGRADVHAYMASVPSWPAYDPSAARTITTGVLETIAQRNSHFTFQADETAADISLHHPIMRCSPCPVGTRINLSVNLLVTNDAQGSATVRGNSYYPSVPMPQVKLTFVSDSYVIPDTGERFLTFTAPFTFSGFVLGARSGEWLPPNMLFGIPLTGAGTATLQLFSCEDCVRSDGKRFYDRLELKYSFEPR